MSLAISLPLPYNNHRDEVCPAGPKKSCKLTYGRVYNEAEIEDEKETDASLVLSNIHSQQEKE